MRKVRTTRDGSPEAGRTDSDPLSVEGLTHGHNAAVVRSPAGRTEAPVWYSGLLEAVPDAILLVGTDGRVREANGQACGLFGYSLDALIGVAIETLLPPRFAKPHRRHRSTYFRHPARRPMGAGRDLVGRRQDGHEFPVEISLSPMPTEEGMVAVAAVRDVSARQAAEEALRASEERYRTLVEQASDGIFIADQTGRYTDVNPSGCRMTGYSRAEITKRTIADLVVQEEVSRIGPAIEEMRRGELHLSEWLFRRKDGSTFPGEVSGAILSDGRVVGILRDTSERRRSEAALRESDERFRAAIDAMQEGFVMQNRSGEIVICNRSAERILGLTADQMMGRTSFDPVWKAFREDGSDFAPEDRPIVQSLTRGVPQSGVVIGIRQPSGEFKWVSTNSTPLWRGDQPYAAIATFTDITARRRAETALRESEARFRTVADSVPVMIWMTDADGNCTYLNRSWLDFTGHTLEEGLEQGWSRDVHPDDRTQLLDEFTHCLDTRQPVRSEYRLRRSDGQFRQFVAVGVPRYAEDGRLLGYIGSSIDNTEQQMLHEQVFESQKLESLGRLAGGVAHDFNNLLTAITGYTELARMEIPVESDAAKFLGNVTAAAERAASLTKQLLMYARRQMVEFGPVNLNTVILGIDPLLRRTIGDAHELALAFDEGLWTVSTNASQMEQVLMNLVVNARDAMPGGGRIQVGTGNVTLDEAFAAVHPDARPGEYAMFSVSDGGPGISRETQERIFEPFFTTKETGKGTGLGLATCYGIVKQSNGVIDVQSQPGHGTTFRVFLPRLLHAPVVEEPALREEMPIGSETILLVDDEPMVRDIAARSLRSQGFRVLEASNGAEALHLASEWAGAIDLLLTDVVMPLMGGSELAQRLRRNRPGIRVLYVSGYTQNAVLGQGGEEPELALLAKPFTSSDLLKRVRAILGGNHTG